MQRFILTGTPGSGKTAILRQLEMDGCSVVEEAATDLIALRQALGVAEPWMQAGFLEAVADLQTRRLARASQESATVQFHDRSVICTLALARYLDRPAPDALLRAAERFQADNVFHKEVFFIRNLGFIQSTDARRISYEQSLHFERIHEETYQKCGCTLIFIEPAALEERVATIHKAVRSILTRTA